MKTRGFTLVEMIVSLAIFSVVAVVALTALMSIMSANRKAQTLQASITNLSYALEAMSREMRVGTTYFCDVGTNYGNWGNDLTEGESCDIHSDETGTIVAFNSAVGTLDNNDEPCKLVFAYSFVPRDDGIEGFFLKKAEQTRCRGNPLPEHEFESVIDKTVVITDYHIVVSPVTNIPLRPYARAVIRISGYTGDREKDKTYFDLQTAVSARSL
jgi:prepilin-type N-terminal cleavage/methylation domain-containing protein